MPQMHAVHTAEAPEAIGPYSQAIVAGPFVYCSGQVGFDPWTGDLVEGVTAQTERALKNLAAVLEAAGSDVEHLIKTTICLTDIDTFAEVNRVYAAALGDHRPARATVGVASLPKGALVEIEGVALLRQ
jgi:2-iminobutanoate/2-iminopropanoate deaminase